jgi:hypothetical protein
MSGQIVNAMQSAIVGVIVGVSTVFVVLPDADPIDPIDPIQVYAEGYKAGRIDALKMRYQNGNPNWELEQVCVGMWASEQPIERTQ